MLFAEYINENVLLIVKIYSRIVTLQHKMFLKSSNMQRDTITVIFSTLLHTQSAALIKLSFFHLSPSHVTSVLEIEFVIYKICNIGRNPG